MWEPCSFFLGEWQGSGWGQPDIPRTERNYKLVLNDTFLFVQSK